MAKVIQRDSITRAMQGLLQLIVQKRNLAFQREREGRLTEEGQARIKAEEARIDIATLPFLIEGTAPNTPLGHPDATAVRERLESALGEPLTPEELESVTIGQLTSGQVLAQMTADRGVEHLLQNPLGTETGDALAELTVFGAAGAPGQTAIRTSVGDQAAGVRGLELGIMEESFKIFQETNDPLGKMNVARVALGQSPLVDIPGMPIMAEHTARLFATFSGLEITDRNQIANRALNRELFSKREELQMAQSLREVSSAGGREIALSRAMELVQMYADPDLIVTGTIDGATQEFTGPEYLKAASLEPTSRDHIAAKSIIDGIQGAQSYLQVQLAQLPPEARGQINAFMAQLEVLELAESLDPDDVLRIAKGILDRIGGVAADHDLPDLVPSISNTGFWARFFGTALKFEGLTSGEIAKNLAGADISSLGSGGRITSMEGAVSQLEVQAGTREERAREVQATRGATLVEVILQVEAGELDFGQARALLKNKIGKLTAREIQVIRAAAPGRDR